MSVTLFPLPSISGTTWLFIPVTLSFSLLLYPVPSDNLILNIMTFYENEQAVIDYEEGKSIKSRWRDYDTGLNPLFLFFFLFFIPAIFYSFFPVSLSVRKLVISSLFRSVVVILKTEFFFSTSFIHFQKKQRSKNKSFSPILVQISSKSLLRLSLSFLLENASV